MVQGRACGGWLNGIFAYTHAVCHCHCSDCTGQGGGGPGRCVHVLVSSLYGQNVRMQGAACQPLFFVSHPAMADTSWEAPVVGNVLVRRAWWWWWG